ncbi:hypothetical protein DMC63_38010 [Streptomyces sp. WAC 05977]|nr:hypothetical protein DMC63_38010 [Streptomyces sp. WAC 05977]
MEPFLMTCMVIAFFLTKGKTDSAAYANGKEPPGVAKARLRHEKGGGARSASGTPKGPGGLRLLAATKWANACEAAKQRSDHKAARNRAWYEENAPKRDEEWRQKQLAKLEKKKAASDRWAQERGVLDLSGLRKRKDEAEAWKENEQRDREAKQMELAELEAPEKIDSASPTAPDGSPWDPDNPASVAAAEEAKKNPVGDSGSGSTAEPAAAEEADKTERPDVPAWAGTCAWGQLFPESPCDASVKKGRAYCTDHEMSRGILLCRWSRDYGGPQCATRRVRGHDYCEVHKAADIERTTGVAQPPPPDEAANAAEAASAPPAPATDTSSKVPTEEGTSNVYEQAVTRLIAAADQVAEYRADLNAFADTLAGKKWGAEVTGPIQDMNGQLTALEGEYRDLAGQMKHQGDQGAAAHEQAPWVPADDSILV